MSPEHIHLIDQDITHDTNHHSPTISNIEFKIAYSLPYFTSNTQHKDDLKPNQLMQSTLYKKGKISIPQSELNSVLQTIDL